MDPRLNYKLLSSNGFNTSEEYTLERLPLDKLFYNNLDDIRKDYCVYAIVDTWKQCNKKLFLWEFKHSLVYIGSGIYVANNLNRFWNCRPANHQSDLLYSLTNKYPSRYKILILANSLIEKQARDLESWFINCAIDQYHYKLTKKKEKLEDTTVGQLINKRRERLKLTSGIKSEYLSGSYAWETIRRKINTN